MAKTAFVSHASQDAEVAGRVVDFLENEGISCWVAPRDVRPGQDYGAEIMRGITECRVMILVLSENANNSTFVKREIERGVSNGLSVFPVRVREVLPSKSLELFIASCHWIDAWQPPLEQYLNRLVEAIRAVVDGEDVAGVSSTANKPPQYSAKSRSTKKHGNKAVVALGLIALVGLAVAFQAIRQADPRVVPGPAEESSQSGSNSNVSGDSSDRSQPTRSESASDSSPSRENSSEARVDDTRQHTSSAVKRTVAEPDSSEENHAAVKQVLEFLKDQTGSQRYKSIQTAAPELPSGLSAAQMVAIIGSSAYRVSAVKLLKDKLSTPLSFQDTMTILGSTQGRERYDTIKELPEYMPERITAEQMVKIIESSAYRVSTIKLLKEKLPVPISFEDTMNILEPSDGRQRYDAISELPKHIPGELTADQVVAIIGSSAYRVSMVKLLKDKLSTPLSFQDTMTILDSTQGRERYDTIRELPEHMTERITADQLMAIIDSSAYRVNAIKLLRNKLPVPVTFQEAVDILEPSSKRARYDTINALSQHLVGLSPEQVDVLANKSSYSDKVRKMLLNKE